ncbi:thioesterase family protein [Bradyrhizobium sp. NDS-1]|uniref:thioesterase family protein n=1 Tax=Bradyrhizobium sp. NDS-1 TaxID=3080014 RepID=UPI00293E409E|nr:thioesterase family protein [Bradyrhizobium sp. NDS-1]WOH75642.1 thioesterase family protein [Bradyrhizobium sp. NDS-1]
MQPLEMRHDWLDYNGHVTECRYLQLCGMATDNVLSYIGIDSGYRSKFGSYYTLETHLSHLRELHAGDRVEVLTQVLGADDKRLHLFHVITREGEEPAATGEQMLIHVDASSGRSGPAQGSVRERLLELTRLHAQLPRPRGVGASIRLR